MAEVWRQVQPQQLELAEALCARLAAVARDPTDVDAWQEARAYTHRLAATLASFEQVAAADAARALEELIGGVEPVRLDRLSRARTLAEAVRAAVAGDG